MATLTPTTGGTSTMGSTTTSSPTTSMNSAMERIYGAPWSDVGRYLTVAQSALAGQPLRYNAAMQGGDYGMYDPTGRMNNDLGRAIWLNAQPYYLGWSADRNAAMGAAAKEPGWDSRAWNEANPMPTGTGLINAVNEWKQSDAGQAYSRVLNKARSTYDQWAPSYVAQMKALPGGSAYSRLPNSAYDFKNASQTWSVPTAPAFAAASAMNMGPSGPTSTTYSPTPAPVPTQAQVQAPTASTPLSQGGWQPRNTIAFTTGNNELIGMKTPLSSNGAYSGVQSGTTSNPESSAGMLTGVTGGGYGNDATYFNPYLRW